MRPINNPIWLLERNPYYYAVDTAGNQLPYFDRVQFTLAENLEVINLRAMAGEYDEQERHIDLGKLPVLLDNQAKGNYKVHLDLGFAGSDFMFHVNQSFTGDPEVRKWLTNADFRRALSLGIDRDQLNETFWLGVGTPGSPAPGESMPQSPGPEWRKKWSVLDVKQANALLDKIGLAKKDARGFRLRTDNGERLRIQVIAIAAFLPYPKLAEMVAEQWRKIGIQADVREMERGLGFAKLANNEHQLFVWNNGGTELLYLFPTWAVPVVPGAGVRAGLCGVVLVRRQAGHQAGRSEHPEDLRSVCRGRGPQGRRPQPATRRRSGRSWSISSTASARSASRRRAWACAWSRNAGQHRRAGVQRAALPHAGQFASGDVVLQGMTARRRPVIARSGATAIPAARGLLRCARSQ